MSVGTAAWKAPGGRSKVSVGIAASRAQFLSGPGHLGRCLTKERRDIVLSQVERSHQRWLPVYFLCTHPWTNCPSALSALSTALSLVPTGIVHLA